PLRPEVSNWRRAGAHLPHFGLTPNTRYRAATEHPAESVCERAWRSLIALQIHTYMLSVSLARGSIDIENDYQFTIKLARPRTFPRTGPVRTARVPLLHCGVDCEDQVSILEPDFAETAGAQPFELIRNRGGRVEFHPFQRLPQIALANSEFAR